MRARRARVDSLRRDILGLEKSAGLRPPSPPEEEDRDRVLSAQDTTGRVVGSEQGSTGVFAEEIVLRDAEGGIRLMPLSGTRKDKGDGGSDGGGGGAGSGARGRGMSVGRLWRWLRRS